VEALITSPLPLLSLQLLQVSHQLVSQEEEEEVVETTLSLALEIVEEVSILLQQGIKTTEDRIPHRWLLFLFTIRHHLFLVLQDSTLKAIITLHPLITPLVSLFPSLPIFLLRLFSSSPTKHFSTPCLLSTYTLFLLQ
jgi:hypothetical protein